VLGGGFVGVCDGGGGGGGGEVVGGCGCFLFFWLGWGLGGGGGLCGKNHPCTRDQEFLRGGRTPRGCGEVPFGPVFWVRGKKEASDRKRNV